MAINSTTLIPAEAPRHAPAAAPTTPTTTAPAAPPAAAAEEAQAPPAAPQPPVFPGPMAPALAAPTTEAAAAQPPTGLLPPPPQQQQQAPPFPPPPLFPFHPRLLDHQLQMLQQMRQQMMAAYPYMYPAMQQPPAPQAPQPSQHTPPTEEAQGGEQTQQHADEAAQQQQQQQVYAPPMYAPWPTSPPPLGPPATLTPGPLPSAAPATPAPAPAAAADYAHGVPTIELGLTVAMAAPRKILIHYVLYFFFLLAAGMLLLGTFFTPISKNYLFFSRSTWDIMEGTAYSDAIGGTYGEMVSEYAQYAPCTVFKRYGCQVLTRQDAVNWMGNITNGVRAPFTKILASVQGGQVELDSCTNFPSTDDTDSQSSSADTPTDFPPATVAALAADTSTLPGPLSLTQPYTDAFSPAASLVYEPTISSWLPFLNNKTGLRVMISSTFPSGIKAAMFLTCINDRKTVPMLNITTVTSVDLHGLVPESGTDVSPPLTAAALFAASPASPVAYAFNTTYTTCEQYFLACEDPDTYVLLSPVSEIRRCGGGAVTADSSSSDSLVTVIVCDVTVHELSTNLKTAGDLQFTARGVFEMNLSLYATSARFVGNEVAFQFGIEETTVLFLVSEILFILSIVLVIVAVNLLPLQRFKLRRLRAALEVDASVAMEILHRAQSAPSAPVAPPPGAESPALPPPPPPPLFFAPPFYQAAPGTGGVPMMMMPQPPTQPPESPYGEGHYLTADSGEEEQPPEEEAAAAEAAETHEEAQEEAGAAPPAHRTPSETESEKRSGSASPFAQPINVVSLAEIELHEVAGGDDDAHEMQSLYSAASEHADRDDTGEAHAFRHPGSQPTAGAAAAGTAPPAHPTAAAPAPPPAASAAPPVPAATAEPAVPNTDWMFSQTRHLVSPQALEEDTASSARGGPVRSGLRWLRDLVLRRRRGFGSGASLPADFPRSDSDDDDDGNGGGPAERGYAGAEGSPGERTIQLFIKRARNSYRRTRRQQAKVIRTLMWYASLMTLLATIFLILNMAFQLSGSFINFANKLQRRDGDALVLSRALEKGHIAQFCLALVAGVVAFALAVVIRKKMIW